MLTCENIGIIIAIFIINPLFFISMLIIGYNQYPSDKSGLLPLIIGLGGITANIMFIINCIIDKYKQKNRLLNINNEFELKQNYNSI